MARSGRARGIGVAALATVAVAAGIGVASAASGKQQAGLSPEKQAIVDYQNQPRIKGKTTMAGAAAAAAAAAVQAPDAWPTGIFEDSEAPASGIDFLGSNRWSGTVNGRLLAVYAGRDGSTPSTGRLLVTSSAPDYSDGQRTFVDAPGAGTLHVDADRGTTLAISSTSGQRLAYDLQTGALS